MARNTQFANDKDVERNSQITGNLKRNRHSTARYTEHHKIPRIAKVHFAGNATHPDVETITRLFPEGMYGSIVAFELKDGTRADIFRLMENLKMVVRATSLGDVHTMVLYPAMASHRDISPKHRERLGIRDSLVRVSAGIEAVEDVKADLEQALRA